MRGIGGVSSRSFQFLTGRGERGFGAFSLSAALLRIHRQLLNWHGEAGHDEMAGHEAAEQKQCARASNLPAQPMQLRDRIGEWVNINFIRRRKERLRIASLIKQELRRTVYDDGKVVL